MNEWKLGGFNKSWNYILPMLGHTYKQFKDTSFPKSQFVNVFIGDDSRGLKDCILLLYRFSGKIEFLEFEEQLKKHPDFVSSYEPDKYHTMYAFNIPTKYLVDFNKFVEGKYSKFSEDYKKHILQFQGNKYVEGVLYKSEAEFRELEKKLGLEIGTIPRDQEASSKPIREREYYQESYKKKDALIPNIEYDPKGKIDETDAD